MELYYIIAVTDRDRAGEMAELYQAAGLHLTLTKLGRGTAPDVYKRQGVLHLLGICMMIYPLFRKLPTAPLAALALCIILIG